MNKLLEPKSVFICLAIACSGGLFGAKPYILSCNGGSSDGDTIGKVEDQTIEIGLLGHEITGLMGSIPIVSQSSTKIGLQGASVVGYGAGVIDRMSGRTIFLVPYPLPSSGSTASFMLTCLPARVLF